SKIKSRGIKITDINNNDVMLVKERMAREFGKGREIKLVESYIYDENTNKLPVMLNEDCIKLKYNNIEENILFM
ncbi:MAG: hypothetical protein ACTHW2_11560, partial [Tissierella sp.]